MRPVRLRLWLLLLLAVLLPVRGAMAAAMLCPPAGMGGQGEVRIGGHPPGHGMQAQGAGHDHAHDHHATAGSTHHTGTGTTSNGPDPCDLCSAFCSATPMPSSAPTVAAPDARAAAVFPDLGTPALSFLSGRQDRPPRSR